MARRNLSPEKDDQDSKDRHVKLLTTLVPINALCVDRDNMELSFFFLTIVHTGLSLSFHATRRPKGPLTPNIHAHSPRCYTYTLVEILYRILQDFLGSYRIL